VAELLEQVLPLASQRTQDAPFDLTARNGYLSPEQRLLCVLKKMGFSSREIAEARHTTVMDIDTQFYRIKRKIRAVLQDPGAAE
jgi:DNA-directed RNA polymerase specialized sigma24 family protein